MHILYMSAANYNNDTSEYQHNLPDSMEIYFTIHDDGTPFIIHDTKFIGGLSWLEYDLQTGRMDYINESGDIHNFGLTVDSEFGQIIQNKQSIAAVYMVDGQAIEANEIPLIQHR